MKVTRALLAVSGFALAFATACAAIVGVSDVPIPIDGDASSSLESGDGAGPSSGVDTGAMSGNDSGTFASLEAGEGSGTRDDGFDAAGDDARADAGTWAGQCAQGQTHPIECDQCGTNTQTCSANGTWQDATCLGQGVCVPNGVQSCNTYGRQECAKDCTWGTCSCPSPPVCTPSATQCSGKNGGQSCDACGQWGSPWTCAAGSCSGGGCSGSTSGISNASCAPGGAGMTDCGANSESCCTSLEVPGGTYYRSYKNDGTGPTGQDHPATVGGFRMDKYLVTVGRFRQFVKAWNNGMGYLPAAGSGKHTHLNGGKGLIATGGGYEPGWLVADNGNIAPDTSLYCNGIASRTWTSTAGSQENLPINCVNWWEAYAFCIWDGGFLPSDAECEYAAAGGSQQREYPWGSTAPGMACPGTGCYAIYGCNYSPNSAMNCATAASIAPVGTATLGAALWGQLDMAGEVFEWNLDHQPPYFDPCTDCAAFTGGPYRAIRGRGAFDRSDVLVFTFVNPAADYNVEVGFRCARTP